MREKREETRGEEEKNRKERENIDDRKRDL